MARAITLALFVVLLLVGVVSEFGRQGGERSASVQPLPVTVMRGPGTEEATLTRESGTTRDRRLPTGPPARVASDDTRTGAIILHGTEAAATRQDPGPGVGSGGHVRPPRDDERRADTVAGQGGEPPSPGRAAAAVDSTAGGAIAHNDSVDADTTRTDWLHVPGTRIPIWPKP